MLYIHYTVPPKSMADDDGMKERTWEVGHKRPSEQLDDADIVIHSIYADGDELAYIGNLFKNLPIYPYRDKRCVWRGELARFIFDNLS